MTNQAIYNGADAEFGKVILWQYDKAENLIMLIKNFLGIFDNATKLLWDKNSEEVNVDTATDYGLAILGTLIGCSRPNYNNSPISTELYRRFIKARFQLSRSNYSVDAINEYLRTVFGNAVSVIDNHDMSLSWSVNRSALSDEELYCIDSLPQFTLPFPAAVRDDTRFDEVLFAVCETQPANPSNVTMNGYLVGGLDDSTFFDDNGDDADFIPEEERIVS
jgi:hypothetical protein